MGIDHQTSRRQADYDCVVVGAGLAGLALVRALRNEGLSIALVDRGDHAPDRIRNWAHDLQPNALAALDELGILDEVANAGFKHNSWIAHHPGGTAGSRWPYSMLSVSHPYAVCVLSARLRSILKASIDRMADVDAWIPARFRGCERTDRGFLVQLATNSEREGDVSIRARLLVGADGPRSLVRSAAGLPASARRPLGGWSTSVIPSASDVSEGHVYVGGGEYMGVLPTGDDCLVAFQTSKDATEAGYRGRFGDLGSLQRAYVSLAPILRASIANLRSWEQVSWVPSGTVRALRWIADNVVLIGDSTVTVNPITSQGACLALTQAMRLATIVKRCFQTGNFSSEALAPYESWCRPEAEAIQDLGELCRWAFGSTNPIVGLLSKKLMDKLETNLEMKRQIMASFTGQLRGSGMPTGWSRALAAALL